MNDRCKRIMGRRTMILGGLTCGATSMLASPAQSWVPERLPNPSRPGSRLDNLMPETEPILNLFNPHTKESFQGKFHHQDSYIVDAIKHLNYFLRDWRANISVPICLRLYWALARMTQELELKKPLVILSGYRTPETNSKLEGAVPNSMHLYGRAIDLHSTEVASKDIFKLVNSLQIGGSGWYPRGGFVHIDSGRIRQWRE